MKLETKNFSENGVALVITLILLSVITFLAVTFLVVSRHASEQVTSVIQQNLAKEAADNALQQAEAQIIATMLARGEGFDFDLKVSTNYQSLYFTNGSTSVANVNYFDSGSNVLTGNNYLQMLNNMLILPRAPVFFTGSPFSTANPDFRFYLDLNRNGAYDPSSVGGFPVVVTNQFGNPQLNLVGDPEWIGVLEHPDQPHSRSNLFVARYCFLAQPIGNSLDIDYIHNQAKLNGQAGSDGFLRNEGVGSWEINLAGFLNGLNPNFWDYKYLPTNTSGQVTTSPSLGNAFQDAANILQFRYGGSYQNLPSFNGLYPGAPNIFSGQNIDGYSTGPLMTGFFLPGVPNVSGLPWSGAGSTNHFFTSQDFYNAMGSPYLGAFSNRVALAGSGPQLLYGDGNFNRYSYYRMLAQMGMEAAPESAKLNLNYKNVDGYSATNFISWAEDTNNPSTLTNALEFFMHAGDALLKSQPGIVSSVAGIAITNIPIYPFNFYTPSVHRMLQLAANIYDAANPKVVTDTNTYFDYPSVFRPIFSSNMVAGLPVIWISGFLEVTNTGTNADYNFPAYSLNVPSDLTTILTDIGASNNNFNIYGIPWIIGAKKGLPNFNQVSFQSFTQLSRKAVINKTSLTESRTSWITNIQYVLSVSNSVMAEVWNSYAGTYSRGVVIGAADNLISTISNQTGIVQLTQSQPPATFPNPSSPTFGGVTGIPAFTWSGVGLNISSNPASSFRFPILNSTNFLQAAIYNTNGSGGFTVVPDPYDTSFGSSSSSFPLPQLYLTVSNRIRLVMLDQVTGRVIDYVLLDGMSGQRNLTSAGELEGNDDWGPAGVWDTNRQQIGSANQNISLDGVINQVSVSLNGPVWTSPNYSTPVTEADWNWAQMGIPGYATPEAAVIAFSEFYNKQTNLNSLTSMQVPYTPTRSVCVYYTWQANDPLVHYMLPDLTGLGDLTTQPVTNWVVTNYLLASLGEINKRYDPWGGSVNGGDPDFNTNMDVKDPLVTRSDDWLFPNGKFPGIGWLGRVHRGTPWQTVYMKPASQDPDFLSNWQDWTGNALPADAANSAPTNDWAIFDLFTTAPNDVATRGQLSVNQTNYAAWAALLDGVVVLSNDPVNGLTPVIIDPSNNPAALYSIIAGIQAQRQSNNSAGVFTRVGDILAAPILTEQSPFVGSSNSPIVPDAAYEWLPQQIMSLLRVGSPRYVIYAYGQSLKPADNSIVAGGPYYGTCTNYQVTGEVATRTVVRFEPAGAPDPANPYTPFNPTQNPVMPQINNLPPPPRPVIRALPESFVVLPPE